MRTVCLLTAGTGTRMGVYSSIINKTLLPINNKAIISHIIEQFPEDTKFVVALGYKGDVVQNYLTLAHPKSKFSFVWVHDFDQPGAGPAQSVLQCKYFLSTEFTLIACDGFYSNLGDIPLGENLIGVSPVTEEESPAYCNIVTLENSETIVKVVDKQRCNSGLAANGVYHIKDVNAFFERLSGSELSSGFKNLEIYIHPLDWVDLGTFERYRKFCDNQGLYDFSKFDEFLYIINGRVIKFYSNIESANSKVQRTCGKSFFPKIDFHVDQIYSHPFVQGNTLYENCNADIFNALIDWTERTVWNSASQNVLLTTDDTVAFYFTKTAERLEKFINKYPEFNPSEINGMKLIGDISSCLQMLSWKEICGKDLKDRTKFIHGDYQFDNIIYDGDKFTLIDWRQDFAGHKDFGDKYYDIAKLIAGLTVNFDLIKQNKFFYHEEGDKVFFDYLVRSSHQQMIDQLMFRYPDPIIDIIVSLIFLNMAPLHNPPFDKLLFSLALQRLNTQVYF